jgi:hypothetical protein
MLEIPSNVLSRRDDFCESRSRSVVDLRGWGVDGYIWQTDKDSVVKVFRRSQQFVQERDVYLRLRQRQLYQLQGFRIPRLLDFDDDLLVLELTYIRPPYVLDFAGAALDRPPPGFDPHDADWITEQRRKFGKDWPDVQRLLDALRQYGIYYTDVHTQNIRVRA